MIRIKNKAGTKEILFDNIAYTLNEKDLGTANTVHSTVKGFAQVGEYLTNTSIGSRKITLVGFILAQNSAEMEVRKRDLFKLVNPLEEFYLIVDKYKLSCVANDSMKFSTKFYENNNSICKFQLSATALSPCFEPLETTIDKFAYWEGKFRFPLVMEQSNKLKTLVLNGATTQLGTGDPSPTNIRAISGVGMYDVKITLTGNENWFLNSPETSNSALLWISSVDTIPYCLNSIGMCNSFTFGAFRKAECSVAKNEASAGTGNGYIAFVVKDYPLTKEGLVAFVSYLKQQYTAGTPVTVYYQSTAYATATQVYCGLSITDSNGNYHGYTSGLMPPLYEGDTLDFLSGKVVRNNTIKNLSSGFNISPTAIQSVNKFYINLPDTSPNSISVSNMYKTVTANDIQSSGVNNAIAFYNRSLWITDNRFNSADSFNANIARDPVTVVYKLAVPATETVPISEPIPVMVQNVSTTEKTTLDYVYEGIPFIVGLRQPNLIVKVQNNGDIETGMIVKFKATAELVNPYLTNITTGKTLTILKSMSAGEEIEINTNYGKKSIVGKLNGETSNYFSYLDLSSSFLTLATGENLLRYGASIDSNLEVSIEYIPKFLGV